MHFGWLVLGVVSSLSRRKWDCVYKVSQELKRKVMEAGSIRAVMELPVEAPFSHMCLSNVNKGPGVAAITTKLRFRRPAGCLQKPMDSYLKQTVKSLKTQVKG